MKDNAPLTMKDIARELGVSVATVSRALKDSPRISPARTTHKSNWSYHPRACTLLLLDRIGRYRGRSI